ncbi:MAG: LamG domain-containing protein [Akkermansiaceae bacterium]|jgi:hypothetical protein|nr:LamG domain-containing protein [Akkermansiaceae bacterium]
MNFIFSNPPTAAAALLLAALTFKATAVAAPVPLAELMPQPGDYTSMWWAEGFPGVIPKAPWKRCVQTGFYAMEQDTVSLQFSHLGPVQAGMDYLKFGEKEPSTPQVPSPAKLELLLKADGKLYQCSKGGPWSRFTGPRLIESGLFLQRADVTDLEFTAMDGGPPVNVEARFETAAWPDRLGMIFAARPGQESIKEGEASFGKMGGGYGLTGSNAFIVPHEAALDPAQFTLDLWVFVPLDKRSANRAGSWLVCKNRNEACDGNYGIVLQGGVPQARLNIGGGGGENQHVILPSPARALPTDAWSHLAISYDGDTFRFYINGQETGSKKIGKPRTPNNHALAFGRREDNHGGGQHFTGVIDEIRFYNRAIDIATIRQRYGNPSFVNPWSKTVREWNFRADGFASAKSPSAVWKDASLEIKLSSAKGALQMQKRWDLPKDQSWSAANWQQVSLALDPTTFESAEAMPPVTVKASEIATGTACPVEHDPAVGWFRVNLDGAEPIAPPGKSGPSNDAIERIKLTLTNPSDREQTARLMFEKTSSGFRQRIGSSLTGISAILRDMDGNPTGIPVQLSKNWHNEPEGGVYGGAWFHGISQIRLPAGGTVDLELTLAYGHWGGVPAASHAQLSLIGWGNNQLWHQAAIGSWGESICFEPEQAQANCTITDVRPLMVKAKVEDPPWNWTGNVGGGDFLRFFTPAGERVPHSAMRAIHHRPGPCLTEVTYTGKIGDGIRHSTTVSLARTDDIVRGIYQIRMDATKPMDFSRFVVFQAGADTYNSSRERKMAIGNETGLTREWNTKWGGNVYRTAPVECTGRIPWFSLHDGELGANDHNGPPANRGIVIRAWKARLGGKDVSPWMAERGLTRHQTDSSTLDIIPPPGVTRLEPGDFIEATFEHIVMPKLAKHYYGPNAALRDALTKDENTWRMIHREAVGNDYAVTVKAGTLERLHPDLRVRTEKDSAALDLTGGISYVPVTFTGLNCPRSSTLTVDGVLFDQAIHGKDFWQSDYDPLTRTWSKTYNIPIGGKKILCISLAPAP